MRLSRRGFLGAAAASPIAARQAFAEQTAGMATLGQAATAIPMPASYHESTLARALLKAGIPEWKRREMKVNAEYSARLLDPDIASMQSVSVSAKYRMQVNRNYQRALEELTMHTPLAEARDAFYARIFGT